MEMSDGAGRRHTLLCVSASVLGERMKQHKTSAHSKMSASICNNQNVINKASKSWEEISEKNIDQS